MVRFRYVLMLATLLAGQLFAFARPTYACSCIMPPAPEQALADASAVFVGQVVDVAAPAEPAVVNAADPRVLAYTFEVSQVWKGEATPTIIVRTPPDSASCGVSFEAGQEYLVYASAGEGILSTNLCSRTTQLANADEDLAALGEGQVPDASAEPMPVSAPDAPDTTDGVVAAATDNGGLSFLVWGLIALGIILVVGIPVALMQRRDSIR